MGRWPWPWRRTEFDPPAPAAIEDATYAIVQARAEHERVRRMWGRVNKAADTLARERETNHFAERMRAALGGDDV